MKHESDGFFRAVAGASCLFIVLYAAFAILLLAALGVGVWWLLDLAGIR